MIFLADEVDSIMIMDEKKAVVQVRLKNGFCLLLEEKEDEDKGIRTYIEVI